MFQVLVEADNNGNIKFNGKPYLSSGIQLEQNADDPEKINIKYLNNYILFGIHYSDFIEENGLSISTSYNGLNFALNKLLEDNIFFGTIYAGAGIFSEDVAISTQGDVSVVGKVTAYNVVATQSPSSLSNTTITTTNVNNEPISLIGGTISGLGDHIPFIGLKPGILSTYSTYINALDSGYTADVNINLPSQSAPSAEGSYTMTTDGVTGLTTWTDIGSLGSSPWTESGNNIYYNTGNVGIGTTIPRQKLHVDGNAQFSDGSTIGVYASETLNIGRVGGSSDATVSFTNANVGIGTTTPSHRLHVDGGTIGSDLNSTGNNTSRQVNMTSANTTGMNAFTAYNTNTDVLSDFLGKYGYKLEGGTATANKQFQVYVSDLSNPRMVINGSGNVGIGTTTPTHKLDVSDGDINLPLGKYIRFGNQLSIKKANIGAMHFYAGTNNTTGGFDFATWNGSSYDEGSFVIRNNGNVGIGTTNPNSKLSIHHNGGHTSGTISYTNATIDLYNPLEADTDEKGSIITFSDNYADSNGYNRTTRAAIKGGTDTTGNTANGFLAFYTDSSGANSADERMRINKDGNVGIGTTTPLQRLHIKDGTDVNLQIGAVSSELQLKATNDSDSAYIPMILRASEFNILSGNVGIGTTSPSDTLQVNGTFRSNAFWTASNGVSYWGNGSTAYGGLTWAPGYATVYSQTGNVLHLGANGASPDVTIDTSGNVGIGTTSPSARLQVNGSTSDSSANAVVVRDSLSASLFSVRNDGRVDIPNGVLYTTEGISSDGAIYSSDGSNPSITAETAMMNKFGLMANRGAMYITNQDASGSMHFGIGGIHHPTNTKMYLSSAGNVGIGTTSPSQKLDVDGGIALADNSALTWRTSNTRIFGQSGYMQLQVAAQDVMRLTSSGNVGIGTTSPTAKLHSMAPDGNTFSLKLGRSDSGSEWRFNHAGDDLRIYNTGGNGRDILLGVEAGGIDQNNKVGIGTDSPSAKLDVVGNANISTGITVGSYLQGASPTTRLRNMTALPGGYVESNTLNFRFDESATAYAGESHAIGGTITQTLGSGITDSQLKNLFTYTATYINLDTVKDSNGDVQIELTGIDISNSANTSWKPYAFFHASATNVESMTIEIKNGAGNWETVANAIDCEDFYVYDGFYVASAQRLHGVRYTFTNITGNAWLRMIGVIGKTHASYQWNVLKSGSEMYGNLSFGDGYEAQFGNSQDLKIKHNGTDSFIDGQSSGFLFVRSNNAVVLGDSSSNVLYVKDQKVGIGTATPSEKLHVAGQIKIDDGVSPFTLPASDGTANQVLSTDGAGTVTWVDQSGGAATGAEIGFAYKTTDQTLTGTFTAISGFDGEFFDDLTSFDTTTGALTITDVGHYLINIDVMSNVTAGTGRSGSEIYLEFNGSEVAGSRRGMYNRNNISGYTSASITFPYYHSTGTATFKVMAAQTSGTDTVIIDNCTFSYSTLGGTQGPQGVSGDAFAVSTEAAGRTLVAGDHLKYLRSTSATAVTFTVPPQSSVSWVDNAEIVFEQAGAGQITIAAGSGVTINTSETLKSGQQYAVIGLKRVASDTWTLTGERELAP